MRKSLMATMGVIAASLVALTACSSGGSTAPSGGDESGDSSGGYRVAFANSTIGNSWHQSFIKSVQGAAADAQDQGIISEFNETVADNDPNVQANQIRSFTVEGYDLILVNATSATALNGAIKQACEAGIVVVTIDQVVTEECAYNVYETFEAIGRTQAELFTEALGGVGNILEVRGTAGTGADEEMHQGAAAVLEQFPDINVVGEVYADWTDTVAQQKVAALLPSLPEIDAIIGQGGDGAGSARAFQAAGRELPMIGFGNRGNELRIWRDAIAADPDYVGVSLSTMPGIGSAGFWTGIALLDGVEVPHQVFFPLLQIDQADLDGWIEITPDDGVASTDVTQEQTLELITMNLADDVPSVITATPGNIKF